MSTNGYIDLPVEGGGSANVPTAGVVTSDGTNLNSIAAGTAGNVLTDNGTTWVSLPPASAFIVNPTLGYGPVIDDFNAYTYPATGSQGPLHLTMTGTVAKDVPTSSETSRYGIVKLTSTTATPAGFYTDITPIYAGGGTLTAAMAIQMGSNIPTNSANSWVSTWGIGDSFPTQANGALFSMNYLSPNFQAITANAGTTTQTNTGIPYVANTWYNFRVALNPTSATFYINGALVATITTNLPASNVGGVYYQCTWQTGAGAVIRADWALASWIPTSPRGSY